MLAEWYERWSEKNMLNFFVVFLSRPPSFYLWSVFKLSLGEANLPKLLPKLCPIDCPNLPKNSSNCSQLMKMPNNFALELSLQETENSFVLNCSHFYSVEHCSNFIKCVKFALCNLKKWLSIFPTKFCRFGSFKEMLFLIPYSESIIFLKPIF